MKGLNIADWSIKHMQIVAFFVIAILLGGMWSYFNLGRSEDPDFTIRTMVVTILNLLHMMEKLLYMYI